MKLPRSEEFKETYWFPNPLEPGDETQHTPIQKRTLQELNTLEKLEQLNPQDNR